MSKPIYKLWMLKNTPELHKIMREEPERVAEMMAKFRQVQKELGMELIISCDSLWANEEFYAFGIEKYPDAESLEKTVQSEHALGIFDYIQSISLLGFKNEG